MKIKLITSFILSVFVTPLGAQAQSNGTTFWDEDVWTLQERGFLYYGPDKNENVTSKDRNLNDLLTVEALKNEAQARLNRAIMQPNDETLRSYLEVNHFMLEKSNTFAQTWQKTLWSLPQYDATVTHPNANFAQVALKEKRQDDLEKELKAISRRVALFFVVQKDCSFCEIMAPVASFLEKTHGIKTLAVYLGHQAPLAWPQALPDNGVLARLQKTTHTTITQTPAIFAVSQTGEARLIASGAISAQELAQRLVVTAKTLH